MVHHISRAPSIARLHVWLLLMGWVCSAQAQGQGSYGGTASGFVGLVLIVIVIAVALVLLAVRSILGNKAALRLLAILAVGLGYLVIDANLAEAKRRRVYKEIERAFAEGCAEATRVIEHPAKGDERIYIRLQGADRVPEYQHLDLLPSRNKVAEGVEVVTDIPSDATNAIVVEINYSRDLIPASYRGYEWPRTRYHLKASTVPEGRVVAHTMDMEARNGFCLGDLEAFLQRALNRPGVLRASQTGFTQSADFSLPDAYVQAKYIGTTRGVYLKSANISNSFEQIKKVLASNGCRLRESNISPPVALCGDPSHDPVAVRLHDIVGIHRLPDSWLLTYRVFKGMSPLTAVRVEQRLADWRLVRAWAANVAPAPGNTDGGEHLEEFSMDGEAINAAVYWGSRWDQHTRSYAQRSVLRVPLPGIR